MTSAVLLVLSVNYYVTIAGLGGEPDYEQRFAAQAAEIEKLTKADGDARVTTLSGTTATKSAVLSALAAVAKEAKSEDFVTLTLIGHGSFDGAEYKLNLPGPDITATELGAALDRIPAQRQLVVNGTSSSGGSIISLQRPNRVVICATKTGNEKNATVFARYWVESLRDPAADSDKNEMLSALEAYRYADQKTVAYYETQKRLATEHAVLEDTGTGDGVRAPSPENGKGQNASRFAVLKLGAAQKASLDPAKQALLKKKEELEVAIDKLKYQKAAMPAEEYKKSMQKLLLDLARLQAEIDP